jgi:hypothetical protein
VGLEQGKNKKAAQIKTFQAGNYLKLLARLARFERAAYGFEVRRSIQLSYRRAFLLFLLREP